MRGGPVVEATVYERARQLDATYVTQYHADGAMTLHYAGDVFPSAEEAVGWKAQLGGIARLLQAEPVWDGAVSSVRLLWQALGPEPRPTVFSCIWAAPEALPVAQADGAPGWGLFPLWTWRAGDLIEEERVFHGRCRVLLPPGVYNINIGVYNWETQLRAATWLPDGTRLPDDYFTLGQVRVGER